MERESSDETWMRTRSQKLQAERGEMGEWEEMVEQCFWVRLKIG